MEDNQNVDEGSSLNTEANYSPSYSETNVGLRLPKFTVNWKKELLSDIKSLGVIRATTSGLTKIVSDPDPFAINQVIHQTFIKNDEVGTEAAAATSVGMLDLAITDQEKVIKMYVNKPFFFTINDDTVNEMLFAGIIQDPTK